MLPVSVPSESEVLSCLLLGSSNVKIFILNQEGQHLLAILPLQAASMGKLPEDDANCDLKRFVLVTPEAVLSMLEYLHGILELC